MPNKEIGAPHNWLGPEVKPLFGIAEQQTPRIFPKNNPDSKIHWRDSPNSEKVRGSWLWFPVGILKGRRQADHGVGRMPGTGMV